MGPTERLEQAIDRLTTYGWCQGRYGNECVGYCAVGALEAPRWNLFDRDREDVRVAVMVVAEVLGLTPRQLIAWNDTPGRQLHEVIGALVLAAELSRRREFVEEPEPSGELVPA